MAAEIENSNEMISVNREALRKVLQALMGPPHLIRELQVLHDPLFPDNPIGTLIEDYNQAIGAQE